MGNYSHIIEFFIGWNFVLVKVIPDNCRNFWIPIVQGNPIKGTKGQYFWIDDRPGFNHSTILKHNWYPSQPNGLLTQQCVMNYRTHLGWRWNDQWCGLGLCSTCLMPLVQVYHLRGQSKFGQVYSLSWNMQSNNSLVTFGRPVHVS